MENETDKPDNKTTFVFDSSTWLSNTIISGVLGVVSLYLLLALIFHQVKVEKPQKQRFFQLTQESKIAVLCKYCCITIGVAFFIRNWTAFGRELLDVNVFNNQSTDQNASIEYTCIILTRLTNLAGSFGSGLVYLFLWFRQRVFYIHPSLKILNSTALQNFGNSVMVILLLYYVSLYFCYFILIHYHFTAQGGCLVEEDSYDVYSALLLSWSVTTIFVQIFLLGMFIYPILKRTVWLSQQHTNGSLCLIKRVKKALILASICLITDLLLIVATKYTFIKNQTSGIYAYSLNFTVNHLVTIACFDHWKNLLWPWNLKLSDESFSRKGKGESVNTSSTQTASITEIT